MVKLCNTVLLGIPLMAGAFTNISTGTGRNMIYKHTTTTSLSLFQKSKETPSPASSRPVQFEESQVKNGSGNLFSTSFTGGLFEEESDEEILAGAIAIASKIKSTKDLGWTGPARRRGAARPRPRAWGGEGEMAIQDKANYDEERENCVEKWLTMEDFLTLTKSTPGPAADTVFVALAGGTKYAERDVCEAKIEQWTSSTVAASRPKKGMFGRGAAASSFNEAAFVKSVKDGRRDLLLGYGSFFSVNTFFASCIAFPTNPAAKGLESLVDSLKDQVVTTTLS